MILDTSLTAIQHGNECCAEMSINYLRRRSIVFCKKSMVKSVRAINRNLRGRDCLLGNLLWPIPARRFLAIYLAVEI